MLQEWAAAAPVRLGDRPDATLIPVPEMGDSRALLSVTVYLRSVRRTALISDYCGLSSCQESDRRCLEVT